MMFQKGNTLARIKIAEMRHLSACLPSRSAEIEIFHEVEQDENVIDRIAAAQREELELEIATLQAEAERVAEEARELAGELPF